MQPGSAPPFKHTHKYPIYPVFRGPLKGSSHTMTKVAHSHASTPHGLFALLSSLQGGSALKTFFSHHDKGPPQSRHCIHLHPMVFLHPYPITFPPTSHTAPSKRGALGKSHGLLGCFKPRPCRTPTLDHPTPRPRPLHWGDTITTPSSQLGMKTKYKIKKKETG